METTLVARRVEWNDTVRDKRHRHTVARSATSRSSASFNFEIRAAREQVAYLNRGGTSGGVMSLAHHCLDAGENDVNTLTGYVMRQVGQPAAMAALFNQFSAEAVGAWGDAAMLWSVAGYRGFGIETASANASFCANTRAGAANYPALTWRAARNDINYWPRYPEVSESAKRYHQIIDVDGDGYSDLLTDPSTPGISPSGAFKRASVRSTAKISRLELYDGKPGPSLVPFAASATSSDAVTIVPVNQSFSAYVDINGDGVVDLVTAQNGVNGGRPRVRPGDGRGGFGCDSLRDVACTVAADGAWVGKAFEMVVPDTVKPWLLNPYVPYGNKNVDTHFIHDVTGDGLADIVAYRPANSSTGEPGTVKLWVNVDGRTFRCASR